MRPGTPLCLLQPRDRLGHELMGRALLLNQLAVQPSTHHLPSLGFSFFTCRMDINKMDRYKTFLKFLRYIFGVCGGGLS